MIDSSVLVAAERGKLDLSQVLERHGDNPVAIAAIRPGTSGSVLVFPCDGQATDRKHCPLAGALSWSILHFVRREAAHHHY